jgi:hypothetical protein
MINLLELTRKQTLKLSAATVALGIAFVIVTGVFVAAQIGHPSTAFGSQPYSDEVTETEQPVVEVQHNEDGTETETGGTQTVITQPGNAQAAPASLAAPSVAKPGNSKPLQPAPATNPVGDTLQGVTDTARGVTYTLKDVVPGDPQSYIGTYGQCPFYEDAGVKGCWPPSNLTCNANWTVCTPKG